MSELMPVSQLIEGPAVEPLTLDEVKGHLRVTHDLEDDLIAGLIPTAREYAERDFLHRALITQTRKMYLPAWEGLNIDFPPLQSVDLVEYVDLNGEKQTWSSEEFIVVKLEPATIMPTYQKLFPEISDVGIADTGGYPVVISYTCGYGDTTDAVPRPIKQGMLLLIGQLYNNREAGYMGAGIGVGEIPFGVKALWGPYVDERFK